VGRVTSLAAIDGGDGGSATFRGEPHDSMGLHQAGLQVYGRQKTIVLHGSPNGNPVEGTIEREIAVQATRS